MEPLPLYFEKDTPLSPSTRAAGDSSTEDGTKADTATTPTKDEFTPDELSKLADTLFQMPPPASADLPPDDGKLPLGETHSSGPMETILHMEPPEAGLQDINGQPTRPPHLTPPPYVHHFDSYSLVKQLEGGGWTSAQAITAMKAVRGLLAVNLDVAQAGLVSKSDVENETYLFRAACSELSTEVKKNRRVADEQMRQQRTTLQHEVDIFTQSLNQEILTLNDTVKGMFNDRRMAVREEQKAAESAIQQINYKISIELNSDARSEIEQLRWVLIRRAALGIFFMVVFAFSSLRFASYQSHKKQKEAERLAKEAEAVKREGGRGNDYSSAPDAVEILAAS